jgi:hypothetical protein
MSDLRKKKKSGKKSKKKESDKNFKKKRIRQEFKNTRILAGEELLASPAKIRSTWILPERQDLFFQTRILYRRNGKRILAANQEKQEPGKNDGKIVDL